MRQLPDFVAHPDPEIYRRGSYLVLDFETTGKEKGSALRPDNHLVLACWLTSDNPHKVEHVWGGEYDMARLVEACHNVDFIVAHNAKFELQWLQRCGYDLGSRPILCTQVAEWVLAGNQNWGIFAGLDACLARRGLRGKGKLVSKMIDAGIDPSLIPRSWLLSYCEQDVRVTHTLMQRQLDEMRGTRLLPILYTRCLVTPVLADIERHGMYLDTLRVREAYDKFDEEWAEVMRELDDLAPGVNPNSPPQMAHFIYGDLGFKELKNRSGKFIRNAPTKQFPDGMPKTDATTLSKLKPETEKQRRFFELKKRQAKLTAALNKNLKMFKGAVEEKGGMIYAVLNQCATRTHRLSSSGRSTYYKLFDERKGCQFQNLPNQFKSMFRARKEGTLFCEADMAQLEYRVAGHLGREPVINAELEEGFDVHRYTASVMNEVDIDGVTYTMRREAKPDTFKPLYGGEKGTPQQEKYYQAFKEKYSTLTETQERWCLQVSNNKMLETEWGMRFHWPNAKLRWDGTLNYKTKVFNYPVQSLATADMVLIGLVYLWHYTRDCELIIINTVHDSVLAEVPVNEMELYASAVVQAFTRDVYVYLRDVYNMPFTVPLGVGMVAGKNWTVSTTDKEQWAEWLPCNFKYDDGEVTVTVKPQEVELQ